MTDITVKTLITYDGQAGDPSVSLPAYSVEKTYSGKTVVRDQQYTVQNTTVVAWDPTNNTGESPSDFDLLVIWSDQDVELEFTCNEGDANEELVSVRLAGGAPPLVLGADDSYYNHSASNAFGGSLDVLDKLRIKESNNVLATVRLILAT